MWKMAPGLGAEICDKGRSILNAKMPDTLPVNLYGCGINADFPQPHNHQRITYNAELP